MICRTRTECSWDWTCAGKARLDLDDPEVMPHGAPDVSAATPSTERLLAEIERLRGRLDEAEATLAAIRNGEVDALVVAGPQGDQIYTLRSLARITYPIYCLGRIE